MGESEKKESEYKISSEEIKTELKRVNKNITFNKTFRSTLIAIIIIAALAILVSTLFFPVLRISENTMEPQLNQGNLVVLLKTKKFKRGDLCAFYWRNKILVKRVIGLPGETINIDDSGNVFINGTQIDEPYIKEKLKGETDIEYPYKIGQTEYFVLSDYRLVSRDSRITEIGCVDKNDMLGKLYIRIWPLSQFELLHDK